VAGSDYFSDLIANTWSNITFNFLAKPFELGYPNYRKQFGYLKVFCEQPQGVDISAVIDGGDPIPLGKITEKVQRLAFPESARGHRCAILLDETSQNSSLVFNGMIFEDCETISKDAK